MYILGLVEGHNCSAALLKDGVLIAACCEERLSRLKNDFGYPQRAIRYCLEEAGITSDDISYVAMVTENLPFTQVAVKREALFTVKDYIKEQNEYWKPSLIDGKKVDYLSLFQDKVEQSGWNYDYQEDRLQRDSFEKFRAIRFKTVQNRLNKSPEQLIFINHHLAHSMYAIFTTPLCYERPLLVLVSDGYGDDCSASVGIFKNGKFEFIAKSDGSGVGRLYRYATLILGMRPGVDEFKVMGLAPYAKEYHWREVYEELTAYLKVNGKIIEYINPDKDIFFSLKRRLEASRFDGIAGGLQKFCEDISRKWVQNCIQGTGITDIVYSGGVAMNIKINKAIVELDEVRSLLVGPSGGDESLSIGGGFALWHELNPQIPITSPEHMYLGPEYDYETENRAIKELVPSQGYKISSAPTISKVADLLVAGKVIGVSKGRMEFGARALGNRSILARPDKPEMIRLINDKIKGRDFWMPFAPIIKEERAKDYIVNPKQIFCPYMTIGFESTPLAIRHLKAALHPADDTMRPQILSKKQNPEIHALLTAFEEKTGIGGLLNTSLNLHGEPICCSPEDSVRTFLNSKLDGLLLNNFLIQRDAK